MFKQRQPCGATGLPEGRLEGHHEAQVRMEWV